MHANKQNMRMHGRSLCRVTHCRLILENCCMPCDEGSEGLPGPGAQLCWRDAHHNQPVKAACRLVDRRARGESSESSHPTDENAAAKHLLTRQPALRSAG